MVSGIVPTLGQDVSEGICTAAVWNPTSRTTLCVTAFVFSGLQIIINVVVGYQTGVAFVNATHC